MREVIDIYIYIYISYIYIYIYIYYIALLLRQHLAPGADLSAAKVRGVHTLPDVISDRVLLLSGVNRGQYLGSVV